MSRDNGRRWCRGCKHEVTHGRFRNAYSTRCKRCEVKAAAAKPQAAVYRRRCLKCDEPMQTEHRDVRVCRDCKATAAIALRNTTQRRQRDSLDELWARDETARTVAAWRSTWGRDMRRAGASC